MSETKKCPRHPERGDVSWFPVVQIHPITGEAQTGALSSCIGCLLESKPAPPPEWRP